MSERDDDLELQALQRELDDAFATTRPRRGYEDELWLTIQQQRPVSSRLAAFWQSVRQAPAMPVAAVAAVLIAVIGVGVIANGLHPGGSTLSSAPQYGEDTTARGNAGGGQPASNSFGQLPQPAGVKSAGNPPPQTPSTPLEYSGAVQLVWTGTTDVSVQSAAVYRYHEPDSLEADRFAGSLGARLVDRQGGNLGYYSTASYTLAVRGTVQAPPANPAYFIASVSIPPVTAAGASMQDIATIFLAEHNLLPTWKYTVTVDTTGDPARVHFERVFNVPGYGDAHVVDASGARSGLEVDISGRRPVLVIGPLPVTLDTAFYPIVSPADAVNAAPAQASGPTVQVTQAELVYVLVPAGDHSFYEPAYLMSGTFDLGGTKMVKHVLVPAIAPSQRAK